MPIYYREKKMPNYKQTLHRDRKNFCLYCLLYFHTAEILERHINDCFEVNSRQTIIMAKKGEI